MKDSKLQCAIIGCGVIAPTHAECFRELPGVELAWACDLVPERAVKLARDYGIARTTTRYRQVMADPSVDCVAVCTDHASHAPIVAAALRNDKHVLCEKALAANAAGLRRMFAAHAARPELVFGGVFQHRFDSLNQYLKELVDKGQLGTVLTAGLQMRCLRTRAYYAADAWRGTWAREGGALLINQAIHFIDILAWLMGGVEAACGTYANLTHGDSLEAEDTAVAALRFRCGALGVIEATSSSHIEWEHTFAIHGTEGSVEVRDGKPLKLAFADPERQRVVAARMAACRDAGGAVQSRNYYGTGHRAQIADFVAAVRDGRPPFVTAQSARHAVDLVLGIYRSQRRGWVRISAA